MEGDLGEERMEFPAFRSQQWIKSEFASRIDVEAINRFVYCFLQNFFISPIKCECDLALLLCSSC